jgi:5-methylcytosine-specific restriction endonuclease McrA
MQMKIRGKKTIYCRLPTPGNIAGRSSSITNAFFNSIIPIHPPTAEEEREALEILGMNVNDIRCVYCGDQSTEWDHLQPLIRGQEPTGFITEIANLVPACGKCNQSKGNQQWRDWIVSNARLSPKTRGKDGLTERISRIQAYERWKTPVRFDFASIVDKTLWAKHRTNLRDILGLLVESQKLAKEIKVVIEKHADASN